MNQKQLAETYLAVATFLDVFDKDKAVEMLQKFSQLKEENEDSAISKIYEQAIEYLNQIKE